MADQPRSKIIEDNPIGNGLDSFCASFDTVCADRGIPCTLDALGQLDLEDVRNIALDLLSALQGLRASRLLHSSGSSKNLFSDLSRLNSAVNSDDFDLDRIKPLLNAVLADHLRDALIWDRVYDAVTESTPPPRPIASSLQQTPWLRNTSSFANSSEHHEYIDNVLKEELGPMYVGLRDLYKTYFGDVPNLETASETFFEDCLGGSNPLFKNGWRGWPEEAKQDDVLSWFADFAEKLAAFAKSYNSAPAHKRRPLAKPNEPIAGSVGKRKMDIGFVDDPSAGKDSRCHWSRILVPGELKSNPSADRPSEARLDLGRYAREVLATQDTRRFVLGFTLCGSLMRIWVFDRLGGIASEQFDINKDGLRFVSTILGFLWMSEEELGFDPTIMTAKGQRFIEIEREGTTERLILDGLMNRARCIAGRATTCWKAYREEDPDALFVVKDSWQYVERDEEGGLLREATSKGAVHVARYYHHETVRVWNIDDDVRNNVRKALDVTKAANYRQNTSRRSPSTSTAGPSRVGRSSSIAGAKRSSYETGAFLPPSKRPCSTSPTKAGSDALPNRIHRRVILSDWGIPVYEAGSREALLAALADCIEGHESLRQEAGLLHRDISIGNLMVSKDNGGFLIDLDLAVKEQRISASGAKGKTGTRAFMAIGALLGEQHSFMHDLESFFWVLFWICIHCDGPGKGTVVAQFDKWNYANTEELTRLKKGEISDEGDFIKAAEEYFTPYYKPMVPWVNRLRKVVFPNGRRWENEDSRLYTRMKEILGEASKAVAGR
ncbi:hypothetical protein GGTG_13281 [Gaeumannomyces tritici R3-111a-1]|uniref:non-specific serine/threonine protein kinase n=1 Tax=Gaeumannomyces tritici (strain R3-111a-1) TaxID=644352 RepID=J3PIF3_GAET3|nr:hypothetical protein GGTG_13281 [Gaeumannomyces tritici R3-111a-1]EJT69172.1 hypothetical protein GGTG_13281 [Gaeumannomyces tritici R3-111a-1]